MQIISIDWLQIFCKGEPNYPHYCTSKRHEYGSKVFANIDTVHIMNNEICTVLHNPRSDIIKPDTVIIKLYNEFLYAPDMINIFIKLITDMNLTFINFSRLDICADFNNFYNNLQPDNFLRGFLTNKYLKTKKSKYKISGNQQQNHIIDYLRIGAPSSKVSAYLYNKSKEMQEVTHKPWIFQKWQTNKLNLDKPIYRLEVSIKDFKIMHNDETGRQIEKITLDMLNSPDYIESLFYRAINTAFRFKINNNTKNKSQMRDVVFFNQSLNYKNLIFDCDKISNSRHTKGVINFLERINNEIRALRTDERTKFSKTAEALAELTDLESWYHDRYKDKAGNWVDHKIYADDEEPNETTQSDTEEICPF